MLNNKENITVTITVFRQYFLQKNGLIAHRSAESEDKSNNRGRY